MRIEKRIELLKSPTICRTCMQHIQPGTEVIILEMPICNTRKRIFVYHKGCYHES